MKKVFLAIYVLGLICLVIFSYLFVDPNLSYLNRFYWGFATQKRIATALIYIVLILLFFALYFIFLWLLNKGRFKTLNVKWLVGMTAGILLLSYPAMLSFDIFNYIATAKTLFFYHENPYLIMPIEFLGDPLLLFTHAANKIALYGPFWIILTIIPYILGFGNFLLTLFSFKIFIVLFWLITIILIWKMTKSTYIVSLFALNPLVVIETLVSGHNDIVMMFFALFSFFLLMKNKLWQSILFLFLSILIKYATLFLIPVFAYALWKKLKNNKIEWNQIFYFSSLSMMIVFFLSPLREEIYSWYAIWFLTFAFLIPQKKLLLYLSFAFSFGLLLRYVPFMLLGTYAGQTPFLKTLLTFVPVLLVLAYFLSREKVWLKNFFHS